MQRPVALHSMVLSALVGVCIGCAGGHKGEGNLLQGGDFEPLSEIQKSPAGWFATEVPHTKQYVAFTWDQHEVHSGQRSVSITIQDAHPDEMIAYNWTRAIDGCVPGGTYELTGWIKCKSLTETAWIVVQCWDDTLQKMLNFATTQRDYPVLGSSDWTRVGLAFEVPSGTREVRIRAGIATPDNRGGQVWFDDIEVTPVR